MPRLRRFSWTLTVALLVFTSLASAASAQTQPPNATPPPRPTATQPPVTRPQTVVAPAQVPAAPSALPRAGNLDGLSSDAWAMLGLLLIGSGLGLRQAFRRRRAN